MGSTSDPEKPTTKISKKRTNKPLNVLRNIMSLQNQSFPSKTHIGNRSRNSKYLEKMRRIKLSKLSKPPKISIAKENEEEISFSKQTLLSQDLPLQKLQVDSTVPKIPVDPFQSPPRKHIISSNNIQPSWISLERSLNLNPDLCTHALFCLSLENNPPLDFVQFILRMNPQAAETPPSGMTALQTAVKHGASLEVIKEVIKACPQALFVGNGSYDPLTYAKIWRGDDHALVHLLERPMSQWKQEPVVVRMNPQDEKKSLVRHSNQGGTPPLHPQTLEERQDWKTKNTILKEFQEVHSEFEETEFRSTMESWIRRAQRQQKKQMQSMMYLFQKKIQTQLYAVETCEQSVLKRLQKMEEELGQWKEFMIQQEERWKTWLHDFLRGWMKEKLFVWEKEMYQKLYPTLVGDLSQDIQTRLDEATQTLQHECLGQASTASLSLSLSPPSPPSRKKAHKMTLAQMDWENRISRLEEIIESRQDDNNGTRSRSSHNSQISHNSNSKSSNSISVQVDSLSYSKSLEHDEYHQPTVLDVHSDVEKREGIHDPIIFLPRPVEQDHDGTHLLDASQSETVWTSLTEDPDGISHHQHPQAQVQDHKSRTQGSTKLFKYEMFQLLKPNCAIKSTWLCRKKSTGSSTSSGLHSTPWRSDKFMDLSDVSRFEV